MKKNAQNCVTTRGPKKIELFMDLKKGTGPVIWNPSITGKYSRSSSTAWEGKKGKPYEGTLLEYLIECGAIPDEKQKKQLAELKKNKKITRKKKPGK